MTRRGAAARRHHGRRRLPRPPCRFRAGAGRVAAAAARASIPGAAAAAGSAPVEVVRGDLDDRGGVAATWSRGRARWCMSPGSPRRGDERRSSRRTATAARGSPRRSRRRRRVRAASSFPPWRRGSLASRPTPRASGPARRRRSPRSEAAARLGWCCVLRSSTGLGTAKGWRCSAWRARPWCPSRARRSRVSPWSTPPTWPMPSPRCAATARPHGARFEITDARHAGYGWRELLAVLGGLVGRGSPPRFVPVPDAAILAAGAAADVWADAYRPRIALRPGQGAGVPAPGLGLGARAAAAAIGLDAANRTASRAAGHAGMVARLR